MKVGKGAEEEKIAVQKIFESFDNLSELLGLEKVRLAGCVHSLALARMMVVCRIRQNASHAHH